MRPPDVLVALSVRDGAPYLAESIESVLAQDDVELRLEVFDNGSSDGSVEIAERYLGDPRVRVVRNPTGMHFYGTLNRALAGCDAPFFVPWACDDRMLADNLAVKVRALRETGAGFAHGPALLLDAAGAVTEVQDRHRELPAVTPAPAMFRVIAPYNQIMIPSVVARTDALRGIGGFDGRATVCGDWLAWMRLALRHAVATVHEPLVAYRVHAGAATASVTRSGLWAEHETATLREALADEALPVAWRAERSGWMAAKFCEAAQKLAAAGRLRLDGGFAAYDEAASALLLAPDAPQVRTLFEALLRAAGLDVPTFPLAVVAAPELTPDAVRDAVAHLERVARTGLHRSLAVGVPEQRLDDAVGLLEDALADRDLPLDVVPLREPGDVVSLGSVVLARFGSDLARRGEAAGLPVLTHGRPDPFRRLPDDRVWERLPLPSAA